MTIQPSIMAILPRCWKTSFVQQLAPWAMLEWDFARWREPCPTPRAVDLGGWARVCRGIWPAWDIVRRKRRRVMMNMLNEFKEFALKGNVVDMAVGIIIGGAFGTIVQSLVKDVIMPPIGLL